MSVAEAYRLVRRTGCVYGSPEDVKAQLADIADYLSTTDPTELGAALLLEQAGYQRTVVQLQLDLAGEGAGPAPARAGREPGRVDRHRGDAEPTPPIERRGRSQMSENDEPTSLTFDTDQAVASILVGVGTERTHAAAVAEQILIANRAGDHDQVEALSSALREQMAGAWDEELEWSGPETEPSWTVIGVYHEADGGRYATSVRTREGPKAAEVLAQQVCREENGDEDGEDPIRIAGVLRGEHEVVA